MKSKSTLRKVLPIILVIAAVVIVMIIAAVTTNADSVQETFWALIPPVIAIALALITKEVYSSLFIGILAGALLYSGFNFEKTMLHLVDEGIIASMCDPFNAGILTFLVLLGIMVALINKAGGSAAFGSWAGDHIKTRIGAQLATIVLGILIFIDDYFNCLTVGSVMRPVTDKHHVSRAKLAYLIDATAAPVCIIAPISSWAAAVSGFVEGHNGILLFIQTIPFNFYALLTIVMMLGLTLAKVDYGSMLTHEKNALNGDLYTTPDRPYADSENEKSNPKGRVIDLVLPIVALVGLCVVGMIYTGGFFSGTSFVESFANSDASRGLVYGSLGAVILTMAFLMLRGTMNFHEAMDCVVAGFRTMVPSLLIMIFAWSLKGMTDSLGASTYVAGLIQGSAESLLNFLPCIIFLIACGLAFATGTSWGTFGILIPIVVHSFENTDFNLLIISMAACMAGSVCGDHCSPISDTTIMSSAGAQSNHINHVMTQLPYAITCAAISAITYLIAGFSRSAWISLPCGILMMLVLVFVLKKKGFTAHE
ncbi:MAG: Na+/H+ antiporter NhaC family protein [Eubacterium sp.]|nr:Na+/H+ antiporter NhaC family protein [Eubacterium sp.]